MEFSVLGFEFYLSILIGCVYLAGAYLLAIGPARVRYGWADEPVSRARRVSYLGAVLLMFLSLNGPLHTLSDDYLFSAHMIQHMLIMMFVPPFLVMGVPPWLIRRALGIRGVHPVARFLTHPLVAWITYNVVFIGWHLPQMYNLALVDHRVHILQHLTFMAVAVMMWWPVLNPVKELERIPEGPLQMMYLFAFAVPTTIVAAFITMSDAVFYPWYALAPRIFELGPLEDQRLGGLIMWIPGMLLFWVAITVIWFRWTREEYQGWKEER